MPDKKLTCDSLIPHDVGKKSRNTGLCHRALIGVFRLHQRLLLHLGTPAGVCEWRQVIWVSIGGR